MGETEKHRRWRREWKRVLDRMASRPFDELVQVLEYGSEEEQGAAAIAVRESGDPRAFDLLLRLIKATNDDWLRSKAAFGLHALGEPRAFEPLLQQVRRLYGTQHGVGTLIWALEAFDARSAVVDLARIICEGSDEIFWASTTTLNQERG